MGAVYEGPDRRKFPPSIINPGHRDTDNVSIMNMIIRIADGMEALNTKLTEHIKEERAQFDEMWEKYSVSAFPKADVEGHRKYHEALIAKTDAETAFWSKMFFELSKLGILAFAGWAVYALWQAFLKGPK